MDICPLLFLAQVARGLPQGALTEKLGRWRRRGEVRIFTPENLHEQIDGAAPEFLEYDFQRLAVADYVGPRGGRVTVSIFDMAHPLNAFGIYVKGRNPEAPRLEIGVEGFYCAGILDFWQGWFLVRVEAGEGIEGGLHELLDIARELSAKLPQVKIPPLLRFLPSEGMVEGSLSFHRRNAFGLTALSNVVSAEYDLAGKRVWLFVAVYDSEGKAMEALRRIRRELKVRMGTRCGLSGSLPFYGRVKIFRRGRILYGLLGRGHANLDELRRRVRRFEPLILRGSPKGRGGVKDGTGDP